MTRTVRRKKQPAFVRHELLDRAVRIILDHGPAKLTVQAVSDAAGVTKGGLFHHFPTKRALVEGIFATLTERLDADIDAAMARDPAPRGRFTRAYVEVVVPDPAVGRMSPAAALYLSALADPDVRRLHAAGSRSAWSGTAPPTPDRSLKSFGSPPTELGTLTSCTRRAARSQT
jgi:AcrR family transcriptional regulator